MLPFLFTSMNWNFWRNAITSFAFGSFVPVFCVISSSVCCFPSLRV